MLNILQKQKISLDTYNVKLCYMSLSKRSRVQTILTRKINCYLSLIIKAINMKSTHYIRKSKK